MREGDGGKDGIKRLSWIGLEALWFNMDSHERLIGPIDRCCEGIVVNHSLMAAYELPARVQNRSLRGSETVKEAVLEPYPQTGPIRKTTSHTTAHTCAQDNLDIKELTHNLFISTYPTNPVSLKNNHTTWASSSALKPVCADPSSTHACRSLSTP
jgi:hypothetical protein